MKQDNLVGIDVSAKELVVRMEKDGIRISLSFDNELAGHKKLLKYITKDGRKAQVCMEATGIYHFQCALYLSKSKKIKVMVINPKVIKHFGIALMQRAKTDPVDAGVILEYIKRMEFIQWQPPADNCLQIQAISRRICQLKEEVNRETNRRHADEYKNVLNAINKDIETSIEHLNKRIKLLEEKGIKIIHSDEKIKKCFELLISIKGIAETSALKILAELICMPKDMQAAQWVAYAGLDPRPVESGSSINKPRRISKAGNKYLRAALYMPAWVAVRHDPNVKAFYDKLIAAGKKPLQAIVAVMRKLLHAIWGMLKSDSQWDGQRFYVIETA
ncbi:MAG: IS110 family transposase [Nitrosomonadaceae bacterium]